MNTEQKEKILKKHPRPVYLTIKTPEEMKNWSPEYREQFWRAVLASYEERFTIKGGRE